MNKSLIISAFSTITLMAAGGELRTALLPGELWWGAASGLGPQMPWSATQGTDGTVDLRTMNFNCQTTPLLLSSQGRWVTCDEPFAFSFAGDTLTVTSSGATPQLSQAADRNLRGAYREAAKATFRPDTTLTLPSEWFTAPIYNTWIELKYNQNQADVLQYARDILAHGYPAGILMIDDTWQRDYGDWQFEASRFPSPKEMVDTLHELGFKVMLWVAPFVSPDSRHGRELVEKRHVVGQPADNPDDEWWAPTLVHWWNGFSHVWDLSNPEAYAALKAELQALQRDYGIDGFKMDGGDSGYYRADIARPYDGKSYDCAQTRLWAQLAKEFPYNELRACWDAGGQNLIQRLGDKPYSWDGIAQLVPAQIANGLLGYAYSCPDMIGGGDYGTFLGLDDAPLDPQQLVRSCQIHALMPLMQFSVAPWRVLSPEANEICRQMAQLHSEFGPYILEQAQQSARTSEPIVQSMAYAFPGAGLDSNMTQYMLGDRYLVAPVATPDTTATITLPPGRWQLLDDTASKPRTYRGSRTYTFPVPLSRLLCFRRQ